jgi:hypothetical protein
VGNKKEFWITNISNMNVTLSDLALNIKAHSSINLLDSKHYHYNLSQLEESAKSGSIFKKGNKIFVRKVAPETEKKEFFFVKEMVIPSRQRSMHVIKEEYYEELNVSDEDFINENTEADVVPQIK